MPVFACDCESLEPHSTATTARVPNRTESFLPKDAESTQVVRLLDREFPGGQTVTGLIVYYRPGGLTAQDKAKMVADAKRAEAKLPLVGKPVVPFQPGAPTELVWTNRATPASAAAASMFRVPSTLLSWSSRGSRA